MASLERLKANAATTTLFNVHAAWLSEAAGDEEAALRYARVAVDAEPEPWLRLTELAGGLFERAGQKDEAAALYKSYLDRHPDSQLLVAGRGAPAALAAKPARDIATAKDGAAEALFDSAGIVGRQNNRETALLLGQLALYLRPNFPAMQIVVGDMLDDAKRYEEANRIYAAIDPKSPLAATARIGMARNLDRMDRFDEAKALLETDGGRAPGRSRADDRTGRHAAAQGALRRGGGGLRQGGRTHSRVHPAAVAVPLCARDRAGAREDVAARRGRLPQGAELRAGPAVRAQLPRLLLGGAGRTTWSRRRR